MTGPDKTPTCPAEAYRFTQPPDPAGTAFDRMDRYQDRSRPFLRSDEGDGYWVFTDHDVILDGLQRPELWSSAVVQPTQPDPPYRWIPIMLDPPEHTRWRQLLAGYFSPRRIKEMLADQHDLAGEIIESFQALGECDFVRDVGHVYPSIIFLKIMGMPLDKLPEFMEWEDQILRTLDEDDPDNTVRIGAMGAVTAYFSELITERRANPDPDAQDVVSAALTWEIDGEPIRDDEVLNCLLLLFLAGLDTVAAQFSYTMLHLATHLEDRMRLVQSPELIPHAVEEMMRAYPVVQTARKATQDFNFHGCPVKAGDIAAFPLAAAGRDVSVIPDAREVDMDRKTTRHLSLGAGPHRCLGSHLARQEMAVLLEEWHRRIPDYELVEEPTEHSGGVWGLNELRLRWNTPAGPTTKEDL